MNYTDLTPEQQEKVRGCKTPEELLALARQEGYELSDEELEAVAGGTSWDDVAGAIVNCQGFGSY